MMKMIAQNKAISFDGVHESIFHVLKNGKDKDTRKRATILKDLFRPEVLNSEYMENALTGRLIPLNKVFPETPTIDQYRPIVALSPVAKILEARIAVKLKYYVKRYCTHSQTGFVQGCGTFINIQRIIKWCNENNKKGNRGILLFIDLRKAYDSVPLGTLFRMLEETRALSKSEIQYLQAWYTRMKVGVLTGRNPTFFKCDKGVLQGSMISPLLFNIFFDSLLSRLHREGIGINNQFAYADDLAIGIEESIIKLNKVIDCIEKWSEDMKIQVNKSKSGIMQLGATVRSKRVFQPREIYNQYRGYPLLDSYKYLGVHLDYRVNLKDHINKIVEKTDKLKRNLRILGKTNFKVKTWILLWKAYILPHFAYSAIAAKSSKFKGPLRTLTQKMRANLKKFMGLKASTQNELLTKLTGFDFDNFSDRMEKLAEYRWDRRCGGNMMAPIFENCTKTKIYSKCVLNHLNWDIIQCWNMVYSKCKTSNGLKSWRHLKECHGVSNKLITSLSPMVVMNIDYRRKLKNRNLPELACELRRLMENESNCARSAASA